MSKFNEELWIYEVSIYYFEFELKETVYFAAKNFFDAVDLAKEYFDIDDTGYSKDRFIQLVGIVEFHSVIIGEVDNYVH